MIVKIKMRGRVFCEFCAILIHYKFILIKKNVLFFKLKII